LNDRDPLAIHDVVVEALAETGTIAPVEDRAAARTVFLDLGRQFEGRRLSELGVVRAVDQVLAKVMYSSPVMLLPLGQLYRLDDEWAGGWGRTEAELKAIVREACQEQLTDEGQAAR
jgi:hypothetical protein